MCTHEFIQLVFSIQYFLVFWTSDVSREGPVTHDTTIWLLSGAKNIVEAISKRERLDFKGWLLGDSGYAQREIPLLDEDLTPKQKRYNEALKKCKCTVERLRCLCKKTGGAIMYHEREACDIIVSCILLHNYCRDRNLEYSVEDDVEDDVKVTLTGKH